MTVSARNLPVRPAKCQTCPFRDAEDGGWEEVRPLLIERAMGEASPICHSTGPKALKRRKGKQLPTAICRGARDLQLRYFYVIGYIEAETDEAWDAKRRELGV